MSQVTTSATVITDKDIQNQQAETVLEVLRNVPGLDVVQSGSRGNATSVFIRGSDSDQVLVLIDGVEVNSTTLGAFNFAHLTTENIERIEILRGAGGTLYGSQAIGGVINIITKKGQGPLEAGLSLKAATVGRTVSDCRLGAVRENSATPSARRAWRAMAFAASTMTIEISQHRLDSIIKLRRRQSQRDFSLF